MSLTDIKNKFNDKAIFERALAHRSWLNENHQVSESNERLEFLGDAVLEFVVSNVIFNKFKDKEEGYLTNLRASLVNTENLSKLAKTLGLGKIIKLSKGEEDSGGRVNPSILADCLEALIGAIFVDQGIEKATGFINENITPLIKVKISQPLKDAKSRLQERVQALKMPTPRYKVVSESGPDHSKIFAVAVYSGKKFLDIGSGKSKSEAEQEAAKKALVKIALNKLK